MRRTLTLVACLVLAGCSSSGSSHATTASPTRSAPSLASPGTTATPASAGPTATAPGGGAASPTAPTGASGTPAAATAGPTARAAGATQATATGTYTYDSSGTVTYGGVPQDASGTATLTVDAVSGGAQHSKLHNAQGDTDQTVLLRPTGRFLTDLTITSLPVNKEFRPSPAVVLLPEPTRVGATWSWHTTSTDGKTTATATNKVIRQEAVTVGGRAVATFVLQTHLVLSGDVDYTADVTTWVSPTYRLPVKDHTVGHGTVGATSFSTDITDVVRSVRPS